jgi:hypothetical protein
MGGGKPVVDYRLLNQERRRPRRVRELAWERSVSSCRSLDAKL